MSAFLRGRADEPNGNDWTQTIDVRSNADLAYPGVPPDVPVLRWESRDRRSGLETLSLVFCGDLGLSGRLGRVAARSGVGAMLAEIAPALKSGDLVFANLESAFVPAWTEGMLFGADVRHVRALPDAGFSVFHMASNHQLDFGPEAFEESVQAVSAAGITPLGVGAGRDDVRALRRTDRRGLKIGWLAAGHTGVRQPHAGGCVITSWTRPSSSNSLETRGVTLIS